MRGRGLNPLAPPSSRTERGCFVQKMASSPSCSARTRRERATVSAARSGSPRRFSRRGATTKCVRYCLTVQIVSGSTFLVDRWTRKNGRSRQSPVRQAASFWKRCHTAAKRSAPQIRLYRSGKVLNGPYISDRFSNMVGKALDVVVTVSPAVFVCV